MTVGTILILNGTSSSGKSTLLRALQDRLTEPCLDAGLDKFLWMLPKRYLNDATLWSQVMRPTEAGPVGLTLVAGMHRAIAALALAGNCVVADHILVDHRWLEDDAGSSAPSPPTLSAFAVHWTCWSSGSGSAGIVRWARPESSSTGSTPTAFTTSRLIPRSPDRKSVPGR